VAYFDIPPDITQEDSDGTGFIDNREVVELLRQGEYGLGLAGYDSLETFNTYLDLSYQFANGIELNSLSAYVFYDRDYNRNNSNSPFLGNMRSRGEDFEQYSQEFRISSPVGGMIEWMAGVYWQKNDLNIYSDNYRGNTRRPRRLNNSWEDVRWLSGFATVTLNFLDDRASIDLGGRVTDVDKTGYIIGYGARWLFPDPPDPAWVAGDGEGETGEFLEAEYGEDGWTIPWRTESIPPNWHEAIGITPLSATVRRVPGPYNGTFEATEFDPQVTLRYRPNENVSLYAKWAQAFKSGGFNTSAGSLADTEEDFASILPEYAENFEIGAKGSFWDDRARGEVTLFQTTIKDLQLQTTAVVTDPSDPTELAVGGITNAGKQRTRGVEFSLDAAVTDQLTARLAGAIMDGEMVSFEGAGCTEVEFRDAATGPCLTEEESEAILGPGNDDLEGTIDRSGEPAPRTPDWKFALKLDYWMPLFNNYKGTMSSNFVFSDGYITNVESFARVQMEGTHFNMNLSAGFGDLNDTWNIKFYARNIFEVQQEYNPEFDLEPDGIVRENLSQSHFRTYGVQLQYNYN
jgi:iron complex outermembrane receptor protein